MPTLDRTGPPVTILMADDDEDDRELTRDALQNTKLAEGMEFVMDGQDLIDYLRGEGRHAKSGKGKPRPRPGIILLDLNMPRKDGREALAEIKSDAELREIPVIVLTTSTDEADIQRTYELGANSFISKPVTHTGLIDVMKNLSRYWFDVVELPTDPLNKR
jgi:CheY-like chemotaxis protein